MDLWRSARVKYMNVSSDSIVSGVYNDMVQHAGGKCMQITKLHITYNCVSVSMNGRFNV